MFGGILIPIPAEPTSGQDQALHYIQRWTMNKKVHRPSLDAIAILCPYALRLSSFTPAVLREDARSHSKVFIIYPQLNLGQNI